MKNQFLILATVLTVLSGVGHADGADRRLASAQAAVAGDYRTRGYMYLSPVPGAEYVPTETRFVLIRFQNILPSAITNLSTFIQVTGASSGAHAGQTQIASDGRTVVFTMDSSFAPNEIVTVSVGPGVPVGGGGPISPYQYQFVISGHWPGSVASPVTVTVPPESAGTAPPALTKTLDAAAVGVAGIMPNGVSVPSDFPWVSITTNNNPDPDPIFINNRLGGYNIIFDNSGSPIWYQRATNIRGEFRVLRNGNLIFFVNDANPRFTSLDTHYRVVTNYAAVNGYITDDHDIQVLPDGSYYLIVYHTQTIDMSQYVSGGKTSADVTEQVLQGFSPTGQLTFQWRAWDHLSVLDEQQFIDLTSSSFDFPHMNAVDIDTDGHILLSARNTSEITKINRNTGDIIWRLGGVNNQFTYVNDALQGTRNQHGVRMVTTNDYTIFDNGNLHNPSESRGVEYVLNTNNMTATLVWQYPPTPKASLFSTYLGNVQRQPNGNSLINWAVLGLPKLTEVHPDGSKAFEMDWVGQWETYRTWRSPWSGYALQPSLMVEPYPDNITLIYNQFGDTNVAFYKIYGGTVSHATNLLASSGVTLKRLTDLQNGATYYFRVTAVNKQGVEGPFSNEATATVNIIKPGQNMVLNGDFSQGKTNWVWTLSGGATAAWAIESGVSHIYITNGTAGLANIQLKQTGKPLVQGKKYVFEFDAWSSAARYIQAMVAQNASPNLNYSGNTSSYLTPVQNHFRYVFTMTAPTDFSASVFFNLGGASAGVYLDNVSLFNAPPGDINLDGRVDLLDLQLLTHDWLKQQSGLSTDLDGDGKVNFKDFSTVGENWANGGP